MLYLQVLVNGLVLGGIYACIASGFSLVWGVLNVINLLHGSLVVIGSYVAYFSYIYLGIHPFPAVIISAVLLFCFGYAIQTGLINRVVTAPVLITLTLTFGLELLVNNTLMAAFKADYRKVILENPWCLEFLEGRFGTASILASMALALILTALLYYVLN